MCMHAHVGEWACMSMHAHMHWWQGIVEGLWNLKVRHTEVQIQCDCSPAVQSRVSVKWGWQDLHCELFVRLQREPKSQHNSPHAYSPRQRQFEHWMLCYSWKALSLLEPYAHTYLIFVAFDRTAYCHLSFSVYLSVFLTALNHLEGRAVSNTLSTLQGPCKGRCSLGGLARGTMTPLRRPRENPNLHGGLLCF